MSSELKTANFDSSIIAYKIIEDIKLANVAVVDVTQGSGTLYTIEVDATGTQTHQYLKLKFTTSEVTVGTTPPDFVVMCASNQRFVMNLPAGVPFTSLSAWLTSSQEDTATANSESAAQRFTKVRFITS